MKPKIVGPKDKKNAHIDAKRAYLGGWILECECPKGHAVKLQIDGDSLSYPSIGKPIETYGWCEKCESEFDAPRVVLELKFRVE